LGLWLGLGARGVGGAVYEERDMGPSPGPCAAARWATDRSAGRWGSGRKVAGTDEGGSDGGRSGEGGPDGGGS
ncbi:hypothetical protein AB4212_61900, partial [Streptomyces sp. 2MCAF27]